LALGRGRQFVKKDWAKQQAQGSKNGSKQKKAAPAKQKTGNKSAKRKAAKLGKKGRKR
jgi:hypothetical protein